MYSPFVDFPHEITLISIKKTTNNDTYPPVVTKEIDEKSLYVFMDTPNSNDIFQYAQREITLSRFMYLPYGIDIKKTDTINFEGVKYEVVGDLEDQGGQHLINRLPLKRLET